MLGEINNNFKVSNVSIDFLQLFSISTMTLELDEINGNKLYLKWKQRFYCSDMIRDNPTKPIR